MVRSKKFREVAPYLYSVGNDTYKISEDVYITEEEARNAGGKAFECWLVHTHGMSVTDWDNESLPRVPVPGDRVRLPTGEVRIVEYAKKLPDPFTEHYVKLEGISGPVSEYNLEYVEGDM